MADEDPIVYHPAVPAIAGSKKDLAERAINLQEAEFSWKKQDTSAVRTLQEHQAALQQANEYLNLSQNLTKMQQETEQKIQAADFLRHSAGVSVTDPLYEQKIAKLHADLPHAAGHPAVQDFLGTNAPARAEYLRTQQAGKELSDRGVTPGETATRQALATGLLEPKDFDWTDPLKKPYVYNSDGSVNHENAAWLAAQRAGNNEGVKAQKLHQAQNLDLIKIGAQMKDTLGDPENANLKAIVDNAIAEEAQRTGKQSTVIPTATPSAVPAPTKPPTVKQGNYTYTLQPDGSYK